MYSYICLNCKSRSYSASCLKEAEPCSCGGRVILKDDRIANTENGQKEMKVGDNTEKSGIDMKVI